MSTFVERMGEAVRICGGSQSELARRIAARFGGKVSPQRIQYLATPGKKKPARASGLTSQIAAVTGLNAEWLATGKGPKLAAEAKGAGTKPVIEMEPTYTVVASAPEEIIEVELTRSAIEWARAWMELSGRHRQELKQLITRYAMEEGSYVPDEMLHHLAAPNSATAKAAKRPTKQRTRKAISG